MLKVRIFNNKKIITLFLLAFTIIYPFIFGSNFWIQIGIQTLLFIMLGQAWNIIGGYAGQWALGNAAFFGIGGYTSTLLYYHFNVTPWLGMIVGGLFATAFALSIAIPIFRLSRYYFAIATLTISESLRYTISSIEFTGGAKGIYLPYKTSPAFFTWDTNLPYYYVILGLACLTTCLMYSIDRSKIGIYFKAFNVDEAAAQNLGINVFRYKLLALSIAAFITAIAGTFYVQYIHFIDPISIMPYDLNIRLISITLLGGIGTVAGPILGAIILIPTGEWLRALIANIGRSGGAFNLIVYGIIIIIISSVTPKGIVGYLKRKKEIASSRS